MATTAPVTRRHHQHHCHDETLSSLILSPITIFQSTIHKLKKIYPYYLNPYRKEKKTQMRWLEYFWVWSHRADMGIRGPFLSAGPGTSLRGRRAARRHLIATRSRSPGAWSPRLRAASGRSRPGSARTCPGRPRRPPAAADPGPGSAPSGVRSTARQSARTWTTQIRLIHANVC